MRPDLLKPERAMVVRALQSYAGHLATEAKRLLVLGQGEMANRLSGEVSHITDFLVKEFADDAQVEITVPPATLEAARHLATQMIIDEHRTRPQLVKDAVTAEQPAGQPLGFGTVIGPRTYPPVCEGCDNADPTVRVREDWASAKMCDTCAATLAREAEEQAAPQAAPAGDPGPWEGWNPGDVPPHREDAQGASEKVGVGESKP